jgi:hypothetical protein
MWYASPVCNADQEVAMRSGFYPVATYAIEVMVRSDLPEADLRAATAIVVRHEKELARFVARLREELGEDVVSVSVGGDRSVTEDVPEWAHG